MKKILAFLLAVTMLTSFAACGSDEPSDADEPEKTQATTTTSEATDDTADDPDATSDGTTENPDGPETPDTEDEPKEETYVYEVDLPDDVILTVDGQSASIIGKLGDELLDEFGLEYTEQVNSYGADPDDYPNGFPYRRAYRPGMPDSVYYYILTEERFKADKNEGILLYQVEVDFSYTQNLKVADLDLPEVSLLGVSKDTTKADVFKVFGEPGDSLREVNGTILRETFYWYDVTIGTTTFKTVQITFANDAVYNIYLDFKL